MKTLIAEFDHGRVATTKIDVASETLDWNPHPAFTGVSLKHLITGKDTGGTFSAHLVRLEPGAEIGHHVHETNWELHEVVDGNGECRMDGRIIAYERGVVAVTPKNIPHSVHAGPDGLCMFAKFIPALA